MTKAELLKKLEKYPDNQRLAIQALGTTWGCFYEDIDIEEAIARETDRRMHKWERVYGDDNAERLVVFS